MKTRVRVDTAREQRDRPFSRAREGEVACKRETRQLLSWITTASSANVAEARVAEFAEESYQEETFLYVLYNNDEHGR